MIYARIDKSLGKGAYIIKTRENEFNPEIGQVFAIIPDKKQVDKKRRKIFGLLKYLSINADFEAILGEDAGQFQEAFSKARGEFISNAGAEWFRACLFMRAGITEPSRSFYFIDGKRLSFDGIKAKSLDRHNAGLKDLKEIYERLKVYCAECGVDLSAWEEGFYE